MNSTRELTRRSVIAAAAVPLLARTALAQESVSAGSDLSQVKALTFDIQGTVVDFYQPLLRAGYAIAARGGPDLDWGKAASEWLAGAGRIIADICEGRRTWLPSGAVYSEALEDLARSDLLRARLSAIDKTELLSIWGRMVPWPDSVDGVSRLKKKFTVAALSNAGMAGVIAVAKAGNLPFDAVLTGELVHAYKPSGPVYDCAVSYLGYKPNQIMMVACHKWDLKGAKARGLRTAYVPRPLENGPGRPVDVAPEPFIDVVATDFIDLAGKLGA